MQASEPPAYRSQFAVLNEREVEFVVIGGIAAVLHGVPQCHST